MGASLQPSRKGGCRFGQREWTGTGSQVGRLSSSMVDKAPRPPTAAADSWKLSTEGREGTCLFHKLGEMKTLF